MAFNLRFTKQAQKDLQGLSKSGHSAERLKKVRKALGKLQEDPKYPGLRSHKYHSAQGPADTDVWDSYVENNTPSAWRIFWQYGPEPGVITIVMITPHP
ncbi:hypothetical protein ADIAG_01937 [Paeniglutamicibacter gangotriensis Lz1y]|uniref:Plasmid maintenance system killer protein n=1 Tax=Paeniglutamicibacter gangotriensis Lz1y TaxID=1276920 RepID=M7N9N8_9MICC|nr:hypothetical protein ADIAG_01937 [Paeniglutamicibacter gangotriensis Lz1y]